MAATETFFLHYGLPPWLAGFDVSFEIVVIFRLILGLYMVRIYIISLPILVAGMVVYRTNRFYFPTGGIEFPIFWAIIQVVQALLGPGRLICWSSPSETDALVPAFDPKFADRRAV